MILWIIRLSCLSAGSTVVLFGLPVAPLDRVLLGGVALGLFVGRTI